ncbi:nitroreductase family protein [Candidatus Bipolaricaulota bacterium]|nr:nitroreductase family protein [Candidatus Bipolaricaulota bacterium]
MLRNPVIDAMMRRASIRSYNDIQPSDEVIEVIVRAGQQAPFAAQLGSLLLKRDRDKNPFHAPLLFTVCVDVHRMEQVMAARGWQRKMSDVSTLLLGVQDAAYMAENMVIAAESLGLGSCYLGAAPMFAERIVEEYDLPTRVFPLVQLAMGYPAEERLPRPRYPLAFTLFEDRYPTFDEQQISEAMEEMDEGYLAQDYYRNLNAMIPLSNGQPESFSFDDYSWTEHISRKLGQWGSDPQELLTQLAICGFNLDGQVDGS